MARSSAGRPTAPWPPAGMDADPPAATAPTPFTCTTNNGALTITKYTGPGGAVTIPSTINGLPVTTIGESAFIYRSDLTNVTIPGTVTSIGSHAFFQCSSLMNLAIPDSVSNIGLCAFYQCSGLANAVIPESVTSIGVASFAFCHLNSIIMHLRTLLIAALRMGLCSTRRRLASSVIRAARPEVT